MIGRAPASEITIDDRYASGRHARVYDRDGHVYLEDMNSTNGTYLNGPASSAQRAAAAGRHGSGSATPSSATSE